MTYFLIIAGFALLLFGGEAVVRGAVALAQRLGVSPLVVGLTIVGFGTSLPEMVVSVNAAMAGATLIYIGFGMTGLIVLWQGAVMLAVLSAYIGFTVWHDNKTNDAVAEMHREEAEEMGFIPLRTVSICGIVATGLFAVVVGAEWLVTGATSLAKDFGVPEEVIGLTVVAIGTSLPELATSIVAAYRGHSDVCVGNVLGSNIFNLFGITGVTALFAPLPFMDKIVGFDLWVLLGVTALLTVFMFGGVRMARPVGLAFLIGYVVYVAAQFMGVGGAMP